jgi:UDP-glucuronate 4-epimerase
MAVLLTGGAGFIGSHVAERLIALHQEVVCVDDFNDFYDPARKWRNVAALQAQPAFSIAQATIVDEGALARIFEQFSITEVIHLAARAGVRPSLRDPDLYTSVNIQGTLNLLKLCRAYGVRRFIHASSSSVYGAQAKVPFSEDDPADRPISPYAATKRAGELLCHTYAHLYGLQTACVRLFTVYGPRQRPDLVIHSFTQAIYAGREIVLFGGGSSARDYTYIDDIVDGVIALLAPEVPLQYEILNLGNQAPTNLLELVRLIEEALGRKAKILWHPDQPGDVVLTCASTSKAEQLLGWRAKVPIGEGIRRFIAWFLLNEAIGA